MGETANLGLALLEPSQAQKHVTVNEALVRLDALAKGVLVSRQVGGPPADAAEGAVWAVPEGASGAWAGQAGRLAIATGGGWSFVTPRAGWRAYVLDEGAALLHDGTRWTPEVTAASTSSPSGAETRIEVIEHDHRIRGEVMSDTEEVIPRNSLVLGVTARVIEEITGTVTSWKLGNIGESTRFGEGLGTEAGSYAEGLLASPMAYYANGRQLRLTATGGSFAGGRVRLAIHCIRLGVPGA